MKASCEQSVQHSPLTTALGKSNITQALPDKSSKNGDVLFDTLSWRDLPVLYWSVYKHVAAGICAHSFFPGT